MKEELGMSIFDSALRPKHQLVFPVRGDQLRTPELIKKYFCHSELRRRIKYSQTF